MKTTLFLLLSVRRLLSRAFYLTRIIMIICLTTDAFAHCSLESLDLLFVWYLTSGRFCCLKPSIDWFASWVISFTCSFSTTSFSLDLSDEFCLLKRPSHIVTLISFLSTWAFVSFDWDDFFPRLSLLSLCSISSLDCCWILVFFLVCRFWIFFFPRWTYVSFVFEIFCLSWCLFPSRVYE